MGMFSKDIVFGGEQLQESVTLGAEYVLWEAGIVARNVVTGLGADGVKAEVVISQLQGHERDGTPTASVPAKFGTFASSIVGKIELKEEGDLPAVIKFEVIPAKEDSTKQDAFVMTFVRRWDGALPATGLPELSPFTDMGGTAASAPPEATTVKEEGGRKVTKIGGRTIKGDPTGADHPLG